MKTKEETIDYLENLNIPFLGEQDNYLIFKFPKQIAYFELKNNELTGYHLYDLFNYSRNGRIIKCHSTEIAEFYNPRGFYKEYITKPYCKRIEIEMDFVSIFYPTILITKSVYTYEFKMKLNNIDKKLISMFFEICQTKDYTCIGILLDYLKDNILDFNI